MPKHIKFLLRHAFVGGVVAVAFVGALLWMNVANLWHLVTHSPEGPLALIVMTAFFWITFGSVQIGIRIMMMGEDTDRGGGRRAPEQAATPVPVRVRGKRAQDRRSA